MKTLDKLNNVEKAKILFDLFPDEIPAFLKFTEGMCLTIKEQEATQREAWRNVLFSYDFWLSLVSGAEHKIKQYGDKLHHSGKLFADQLFDGYMAGYTSYCLIEYTTLRKHPNIKFTIAVDLLFA